MGSDGEGGGRDGYGKGSDGGSPRLPLRVRKKQAQPREHDAHEPQQNTFARWQGSKPSEHRLGLLRLSHDSRRSDLSVALSFLFCENS